MLWITLTIFLGIAAAVLIKLRKRATDGLAKPNASGFNTSELTSLKRAMTISMIAVAVVWMLLTCLMSVRAVGAGEIGVVRQFGGIVGQETEGIAMIAPWQSMDTVSIRTERHTFGTVDQPITAASSETQDVFVIATINYSVSATNAQDLIRDVGSNWFEVLVPSRVNQYIKQETARWKTIDIIPNREVIRQAVLARLQADLGSNYSITVSDFLLDNISFSPEYTDAIEAKQVATENAQAEQNRTVQVQEVANQGVLQAQGQADQLRAVAEGQADANATLNASLTPELLQWQAIQQLGDNIQIALVPSGEGLILDPSTLLSPTTTAP